MMNIDPRIFAVEKLSDCVTGEAGGNGRRRSCRLADSCVLPGRTRETIKKPR